MKNLTATYDYSTVIENDTDNIQLQCNSVIFDNTGVVDAIINNTYILQAGKTHEINNNWNVIIGSLFKITFALSDNLKRVNIIKEYLL